MCACPNCGRETDDPAGGACAECRARETDALEPLDPASDPPAAPARATSGAPETTAARRRGGYYLGTLAAGVMGAALTLVMLGRPGSPPERAVGPELTPAVPAAGSVAMAPSPRTARWSSRDQAKWISNHRKSVAFELPADNKVAVWMEHVRPVLVVRCLARSTDVFVVTDTAAAMEPGTDDHTVRIAFDDDPAREERWPDSVHHDALFAPDGAAFARRLTRARTLRFGFTPHNAAPATASFDLTGSDEVIAAVARTCGWRAP